MSQMLENKAALMLTGAFAVTGFLFVASKLFGIARLGLSLFVLPGKPLRTFGPKRSWALVTGASDGIGKEFSLQLARSGFNIILVSRTQSKLSALASTIESSHSVDTKTLAIDFAAPSPAQTSALAAMIAPLDIAILINNVGQSHDIPTPFALTPSAERDAIIEINCASTLRTTAAVLPGMLQRRRGLILTMGSFGGLLPTPLLATYSGSKAFLQQWSTSLGSEVASQGVTVELVQSYLVTSAMSKIRKPSASIPTPKAFVNSVLSKIGRSGGAQGWAYTSTPYWSHALMQYALASTVGFMGGFVVKQNGTMHEAIRKRALKKRERDGKKIA